MDAGLLPAGPAGGGNVAEWTLDWFAAYARPCTDCAFLTCASQPTTIRVQRGGSFETAAVGPEAS